MKQIVIVALILCLLAGCGGEAPPTPDLVATQVAVERAAAATLTAEAPTSAPPITPTVPPSPTSALTSTPVPTQPPTAVPTLPPPPTDTPRPAPTHIVPTPTLKPTATPPPTTPPFSYLPEPYAVVGVAIDDDLNVRTGPGTGYAVTGTIPPNGQGVRVADSGVTVDGSLWLPVWYEGVEGWANSRYLAQQVGLLDPDILARAVQAIMAIRDLDLDTLAGLVHPEQGVRFSPYTYVRVGEDVVFGADAIPGLLDDPTVYTWGVFDGTGDPIQYTFQQYYGRFIYDVDFAEPEYLGLNETIGQGNTINNIAEVYPLAVAVEYHFSGFDPQYAGLDWRSLRLVLEELDGVWYLVGIVHDEWTI